MSADNRYLEALAMVRALDACETMADLDALYVKWIGYSIAEDDPTYTAEDARDVLRDWIKEICYETGVHCASVGLFR